MRYESQQTTGHDDNVENFVSTAQELLWFEVYI